MLKMKGHCYVKTLRYDKSAATRPVTVWFLLLLISINEATSVSLHQPEDANSDSTESTLPIKYYEFHCLPTCECDYDKSSLRLEINCHQSLSTTINKSSANVTTNNKLLGLIDGVKTLILKNLVLVTESDYLAIPTLMPLGILGQLELENVSVDPIKFFNSYLITSSNNSLQNISITKGETTMKSTEIYSMDYSDKLKAFSRLGQLDSLVVCDSNPVLSQIMLQALPPNLQHLVAVNNSVSTIYYYSFSHLASLQTLNLSNNHLTSIPKGLFDELEGLKSLDLSHNYLAHLQENVFSGLTSLRKLDVSQNKIQYVDAEVFTALKDLQTIDLASNEVIQFFEPYFKHNMNLKFINMSDAWMANTFTDAYTTNRSYREMEGLITTLKNVQVLDLSNNEMTAIPETLSHAPHLSLVYLNGNPWSCNCNDRWLLNWITTSNVTINNPNDTFCFPKPKEREEISNISEGIGIYYGIQLLDYMTTLENRCSELSEIKARYAFKFYSMMGKDTVLTCHTRIAAHPRITWITPSKTVITLTSNYTSVHQNQHDEDEEPTIYPDGALLVHKVQPQDYGLYLCVASYDNINITHYVHLGMDVSVFKDVRFMSIIVGLISSFGFLLLVLIAQGIRALILRSGLHCIAVRTANQTRRVRAFFDYMEQNKNNQLEWLRQNYNMQAKKIQDNCISQLERIRESYTNQTKNLSEFREYSSLQLSTIRDQYQDQIRKVANYSANRLGKVRENYVFNRNRVGKFSSHQLIRFREAYKWQAQTLSKILENLPQGLNLDACRGVGACGRTDSMYLDDEDMESFLAHSSTSNRSSLKQRLEIEDCLGDKHEHISLLIPPEFLASYLLPPLPSFETPSTSRSAREREFSTPMTDISTQASTSSASCSCAGGGSGDSTLVIRKNNKPMEKFTSSSSSSSSSPFKTPTKNTSNICIENSDNLNNIPYADDQV